MIIGWQNHADNAIVTAGHEVATLPAANVQNEHLSKRWHTPSTTLASHLIFDMGGALSCALLGVFGTNFTGSSTFRLRASNTDPTVQASLLYDSGVVSGGIKAGFGTVQHSFTAVAARYWRIDFVNFSPENHIEGGRVFLGPKWIPVDPDGRELGPLYGWSVTLVDRSVVNQTIGGQDVVERRPVQRVLRFALSWMSESQIYDNAFNLALSQGLSRDVFVIREITSAYKAEQSVWGLLTQMDDVVHEHANVFATKYEVRERR